MRSRNQLLAPAAIALAGVALMVVMFLLVRLPVEFGPGVVVLPLLALLIDLAFRRHRARAEAVSPPREASLESVGEGVDRMLQSGLLVDARLRDSLERDGVLFTEVVENGVSWFIPETYEPATGETVHVGEVPR